MNKQATITAVSIGAILLLMLVSMTSIPDLDTVASTILGRQDSDLTQCIQSFSSEPIDNLHITKEHLNEDALLDALVMYVQEDKCGSAGCIIELCISNDQGTFEHVPFGFAGTDISVLNTVTNSMKDLMLNKDKHILLQWNGSAYELRTN